jgi:hypothetical protein
LEVRYFLSFVSILSLPGDDPSYREDGSDDAEGDQGALSAPYVSWADIDVADGFAFPLSLS